MAAFDFQSLSTAQVQELAQLANAAYAGETPPSGWTQIREQEMSGASARAFQNGSSLTVSFRGTDDPAADALDILSLLVGNSYINEFSGFLNGVVGDISARGITEIFVTGHSLGGAAANILRDVSGSQFGGAFSGATYVTFASPKIASNQNILNIGHENDWVFKAAQAILSLPEFPSTTDHIVWYNELLALNNDLGLGTRSVTEFAVNADSSPHKIDNYIDTIARVSGSEFYSQTTRDMTILVDEVDLLVTPLGSSSSNATGPALILGEARADAHRGGSFGDFIEGLGGNDFLEGLGGNDNISGGTGNDEMVGGAGNDTMNGGAGQDAAFFTTSGSALTANLTQGGANAVSGLGRDTLLDVEDIAGTNFNDSITGDNEANLLVGLGGNDMLFGNGGDDTLMGGSGTNVMDGGSGNDALDAEGSSASTLTGGSGADAFLFNTSGSHRVTDYQDGQDFLIIDAAPGTLFAALTVTQQGADTQVTLGGLTLLLETTASGLLDAGDVLFV